MPLERCFSIQRSSSMRAGNSQIRTTELHLNSRSAGMTGTLGRRETHTYHRETTTYQSTASAPAPSRPFQSPFNHQVMHQLDRSLPPSSHMPGLQSRPTHVQTTITTRGTLQMQSPFHREVPVTVVDTRLPSASAYRRRDILDSIGPTITVTRSGESSRPCPTRNGASHASHMPNRPGFRLDTPTIEVTRVYHTHTLRTEVTIERTQACFHTTFNHR